MAKIDCLRVQGQHVAAATTSEAPTQVLVGEGSPVSSITDAATLFSGADTTAEEADETPKKQCKPKCKYPNFFGAFRRDNPLLLGDKLDGWDDEQRNLEALTAAQKELEVAATCNWKILLMKFKSLNIWWRM